MGSTGVFHERFRAMACGASGASIRLATCASAAAALPAGVPPVMPWVALALALTAAVALPASALLRVLGGFVGNGRRFRHGFWASVRFSAVVVRCRLL